MAVRFLLLDLLWLLLCGACAADGASGSFDAAPQARWDWSAAADVAGASGERCACPADWSCGPHPDPACPGVGCGLCPEGFVCTEGSCAPNCEANCAGRDCGPDPMCGLSCGVCEGRNEVCDEGRCVHCEPDCVGRTCGPATNCPSLSCGTCLEDTVCSEGRCVSALQSLPLGASCRPDASCAGDPAERDACGDAMCASGLCWSFHAGFDFCTRRCTLEKDVRSDGRNEDGPDGIDDLDVSSVGCRDSSDALFDAPFRCVSLTSLDSGSTAVATCLPGSDFRPCAASGDCPDGESCQPATIAGRTAAFCLAYPREAVPVTEACNEEESAGALRLCASGLCEDEGCSGFCRSDDDCRTFTAGCDPSSGRCREDPQVLCAEDGDCGAWLCAAPRALFTGSDEPFALCAPRDCATNADCRDGDFYCRLGGRVVEAEAAGGAVWLARCARRPEGSVEGGRPCEPAAAAGDADYCHSGLCEAGECATLCRSDLDCAVSLGQRCLLRTQVAGRSDALAPTVEAPLGLCLRPGDSDEASGACRRDGDCAGDRSCARYVTGDYQTAWQDARVAGLCTLAPVGSLSYGRRCGLAEHPPCGNEGPVSACLRDGEDAGAVGHCSRACIASADCPDMPFEDSDGRSTLRPALCTWKPVGGDFPGELTAGFCAPASPGSSLADCAESLSCSDDREACRPLPTGEGGRAEFRCLAPTRPAAEQLPLGEPCAIDGDCASGLCLAGAAPFCSAPCRDDGDCADSGLRCTDHRLLDLPGEDDDVSVLLCVP